MKLKEQELLGVTHIEKICTEATLAFFELYDTLEDGFNIVTDMAILPRLYERVTAISGSIKQAKVEATDLSVAEVAYLLKAQTKLMADKIGSLDTTSQTQDINIVLEVIDDLFDIIESIESKMSDGFQLEDLEVVADLWIPLLSFIQHFSEFKEEVSKLNFVEVATIVGAIASNVIQLINEDK